MKKQLLLILLCYIIIINITQAQTNPTVVLSGVVFDNPYLHVNQNTASFTSANNANIGTRVIAALDDVIIQSSKGSHSLGRGQVVVFLENESYQISSGNYFEIGFKKDHPPLTYPDEWVEPQKNTTVYEDAQFRIFEERLDAGDIRELHSHA